MRKRKVGRKFSRKRGQRLALLRGLAASLCLQRRIITTEARAKELRSVVERALSYEKRGGIANRRRVSALVGRDVEKKILEELMPRFEKQSSGYTRIRKIGSRKSDGAKMVIIEFVT